MLLHHGEKNPRTLAAFCSGAELKSGGLRSVVAEMSRQIASKLRSGSYPLLLSRYSGSSIESSKWSRNTEMRSLPRNRVCL